MKVKPVESPPRRIPVGGQVREVSERGTHLTIGCEELPPCERTGLQSGNL
jgi:hypothetical protein